MQRSNADPDARLSGGLRLLLLEDIASEAELAVRQLKSEGVTCQWRCVETESAFRQALLEFKPSLILSDFSLPQFDGLAALRIAQEITPDTPFIFLSGTMGEERAIEALQLGAIDYVLKTNRARLVPAVKRALREAAFRAARIELDERLRLSEERLRDIVETSQDWIWELDADGKFVFSNDQVTATLGMRSGELIGTYFGRYVHPTDRVRVERALRSLGTERRSATQLVARWLHSDGSHRWLECNVLALVGLQGEIRGYRGADRDVTERKDQEARISRLTRVLEMLSGINGAVIRIQGRDALLQEACRLAAEVGGYSLAGVTLIEPGTQSVQIVAHAGQATEKLGAAQLAKIEAAINELSVTGRALHDGTVFVCNDLRTADIPVPRRQELLAIGLQSLVALPLIVDETPIGALTLSSTELSAVSDEELQLLREVAVNLSFALQYLQKEDAVRFLSYFDPLTGLARRSLFCERLARAMQRRGSGAAEPAVIVFDVERLSALNDSFGRYVGDALLKEIAARLKEKFEDTDQLAHLGGGVYAMTQPLERQYVDTHDQLLEQVASLFQQPFALEGREIRVAVRSGIAQAPDDGRDANTLVQNAEVALRRAKESNERFLHFDQRMNAELAERLKLENKLRGALEQQQFVLHYQPKISFASGEIVGAEALLRWQDPDNGLVAPGRFLPLLEATGMIVEVGDWVLRQAAADCQQWRDRGLPPLRVAVNVSWMQLRRRDFVEQVVAIVQPWSTADWGLDLEITESGLLQDLEGAVRKLEALRRAGLRIAIDDFGTGYSSLSRLSTLPVDTLKIDRSFVSALSDDPATMAIVSSIIGLAQAFRMTSVAEGVETPEQFKLLKFMNCQESQGYLHSRPVPAADFVALLQSSKTRAGT